MAASDNSAFDALREVLRVRASTLTVTFDTPMRYGLEAAIGPATLAAWGGKARRNAISVAWVERGKTYVSYHLMGLDGNSALLARLSPALKARMQGKTCFNFRETNSALFAELGDVTEAAIAGLRRAGFITA